MSTQDEREHGSAYHSYAEPYARPERDPLVVYVQFKLLPSTEERLVQMHGGASDVHVAHLALTSEHLAADVSEQVAQVEKFRSLMEKNFSILTALDFEISFFGACVWRKIYDPDQNAALYRSWRHWAWTVWENTPEVIAHTNLKTKDICVMPLPGPWRYAFL